MLKRIISFCKKNEMGIFFHNGVFQVKCKETVLYQSTSYADCLEYLTEVMIVDKHTNH